MSQKLESSKMISINELGQPKHIYLKQYQLLLQLKCRALYLFRNIICSFFPNHMKEFPSSSSFLTRFLAMNSLFTTRLKISIWRYLIAKCNIFFPLQLMCSNACGCTANISLTISWMPDLVAKNNGISPVLIMGVMSFSGEPSTSPSPLLSLKGDLLLSWDRPVRPSFSSCPGESNENDGFLLPFSSIEGVEGLYLCVLGLLRFCRALVAFHEVSLRINNLASFKADSYLAFSFLTASKAGKLQHDLT